MKLYFLQENGTRDIMRKEVSQNRKDKYHVFLSYVELREEKNMKAKWGEFLM
jgi:hypothetical protein